MDPPERGGEKARYEPDEAEQGLAELEGHLGGKTAEDKEEQEIKQETKSDNEVDKPPPGRREWRDLGQHFSLRRGRRGSCSSPSPHCSASPPPPPSLSSPSPPPHPPPPPVHPRWKCQWHRTSGERMVREGIYPSHHTWLRVLLSWLGVDLWPL